MSVATLQAQPWFSDVERIFASDGVPDPVWEATVLVEDPGGSPSARNFNPATGDDSYGLFQINLFGSLASDSARQLAAHGSATDQANWAAPIMAQALAKLGSGATYAQQLQAVENAAWPGNLSEDTQRQAALATIVNPASTSTGAGFAGGSIPVTGTLAGGATPTPAATSTPAKPGGLFGGVASVWADAKSTISGWLLAGLLGSLALAVIAGGFAILAGGGGDSSGDGTRYVPVPV